MPSIYANANDGTISSGNNSSFSNARATATGTNINTSGLSTSFGVGKSATRGGGSNFTISRAYFKFDTSGITNTVSSATFKFSLAASVSDSAFNIILISSDAFTNSGDLQNADFNNIDFSTPFTSEIDLNGQSADARISATLNSDALSLIQSEDTFIVALVNHEFDFSNSAPTSNGFFTPQVKFGNNSDNANKPEIEYTEGAAASGPDNVAFVNTVAAASIATVNKVAYSSIETINTVS